MKILIVEDELPAYKRLLKMIKEQVKSVSFVANFDTIQATEEWLSKGNVPDLAFFDIHLADGSIFDLLAQYKPTFPIIFITAFDQFALEAFKTNSLSYLMKPISKVDLHEALQKIKTLEAWVNKDNGVLASPNPRKKRFIIRFGEHLKTLQTEEIAYCFSENKMTYAKTYSGQKLPMDYNLDTLESMLEPEHFFRINRQYIVNLNAIGEMKIYTKGRVLLHIKPDVAEGLVVSAERASDFKLWLAGEL